MQNDDQIKEILLNFIEHNDPDDVETCINFLKRETGLSYNESEQIFLDLVNLKKIILTPPKYSDSDNFISHILSENSNWYRIVVSLVFINSIIYFIPKPSNLNFLIGVIGFIHSFILPGFSLYKILFPLKEKDHIEIIIMSLGLSITFIPMVVYFTYFLLGKLEYLPVILTITFFTLIVSFIGVYQEYHKIRLQ